MIFYAKITSLAAGAALCGTSRSLETGWSVYVYDVQRVPINIVHGEIVDFLKDQSD